MKEHYIIENIWAKDGVIKEVHKEILGCECWPMKIEVGRRGWLLVDVGDEEFGPHRIVLSNIQQIDDNENELCIHTENTVYHLKEM